MEVTKEQIVEFLQEQARKYKPYEDDYSLGSYHSFIEALNYIDTGWETPSLNRSPGPKTLTYQDGLEDGYSNGYTDAEMEYRNNDE